MIKRAGIKQETISDQSESLVTKKISQWEFCLNCFRCFNPSNALLASAWLFRGTSLLLSNKLEYREHTGTSAHQGSVIHLFKQKEVTPSKQFIYITGNQEEKVYFMNTFSRPMRLLLDLRAHAVIMDVFFPLSLKHFVALWFFSKWEAQWYFEFECRLGCSSHAWVGLFQVPQFPPTFQKMLACGWSFKT